MGSVEVFEGVLAVAGVFRIGVDGLLADLGGLAVVVEIGAVVGVAFVLLYQAGGEAVREGGELFVITVFGHQVADGFLVGLIFLEDAVDEIEAFVVVVEHQVLVVLVLEDELLVETQAADDGFVAVAEVGFGELQVVEPPESGVPVGLEVVGGAGFPVVFRHAVEEEVEHGGLIFEIGASGTLEEGHVGL